jgi:hypothetical protein
VSAATGLVYFCCEDRRRAELRKPGATLNGIDFLEVVDAGAAPADRQRVLRVHFVNPPGLAITAQQVRIEGGERIRSIGVVDPVAFDGDVLVVRVTTPGDYSTYTLRIGHPDGTPLPGMDSLLSAVDFSFKVECASDFDCEPECECPPEDVAEPEIDYLAKDYESFRRLLLDRLALLVPEWKERSEADVGIALLELLAYVGDYLSYQQDAVATEAYLGTARRRESVRRHATLVDYAMHDGCNARVWVQVEVQALEPGDEVDGIPLDAKTQLLTQLPARPRELRPNTSDYDEAIAAGPEVFETMHAAKLWPEHQTLPLYVHGERDCCLPAGATKATLDGHFPHLGKGDVLILEEVRGPATGEPADADPARRHAVRLSAEPRPVVDPLFADRPITEIAWGAEDALPFPLCVTATTDAEHGARPIDGVSVARGNVVLADHGRTIEGEPLGAPEPGRESLLPPVSSCERCGPRELVQPPARFAPPLLEQPLTQAARSSRTTIVAGHRERLFFDPIGSAASALAPDLAFVLPVIELHDASGRRWLPQRDLLSSDAFASEFVAEVAEDGSTGLRFGDGTYGERPVAGVAMTATYRVGNGARGNVGAGALFHLVTNNPATAGRVLGVRNPMPARGGTDPESLEHVRQSAPVAFRTLERAVTAEDYATVAERHPEVQRAQATIRWTGSWRTVFLTIDRLGGRPVDETFAAALREHLERYRMAGHDLEIERPRFVSLEVELFVCVQPGYFRSHVEAALREVLSNRTTPSGQRGAFHPDNFTFGQPVYLSKLYAAAQAVPGVAYVEAVTFQRLGLPGRAALEAGVLPIGRLEIARLDSDPSFPERGVLRLTLKGGR